MDSKIVGGQDAVDNRYPYMASLQHRPFFDSYFDTYKVVHKTKTATGEAYLAKGNQNHFCGAVLLTNKVLLTAAHCVDSVKSPTELQVSLGCNDLLKSTCLVVGVSDVSLSSLYNEDEFGNDIGLIFLQHSVDFSPVALAGSGLTPMTGQVGYALGWRTTFDAEITGGSSLQEVELTVVESSVCLEQLETFFGFVGNDYKLASIDLNSIVCSIGDAEDVCFGDSGGPFLYKCDDDNVSDVVFSLVSFGFGCALEGAPGVYERVNSVQTLSYIAAEFLSRGLDFSEMQFVSNLQGYCSEDLVTSNVEPTPFPTFNIDADWTCDLRHFGGNDGCHCDCGVPDPDCELFSSQDALFGCDNGQICRKGLCFHARDSESTSPFGVVVTGFICVLIIFVWLFTSCKQASGIIELPKTNTKKNVYPPIVAKAADHLHDKFARANLNFENS